MTRTDISSFPAEILIDIFFDLAFDRMPRLYPGLLQINTEFSDYDKKVLLETPPPVILAQVCARWRSIALSCSGLWAILQVGWTGRNDARNVQICKCCIERSRNHPLYMSMIFCEDPLLMFWDWENDQPLPEPTRCILAIILPQAHRLKFLYLHAYQSIVRNTFSQLMPNSFPILEGLHLSHASLSPSAPDGKAFSRCSHLRLLSITSCDGSFQDVWGVQFPWAQLTHLNCCIDMTAEDVVRLLQVCAQLETATFHLERFFAGYHSPFTAVANSLRSLDLKSSTSATEWLLPHITVPALKCLKFAITSTHDCGVSLCALAELFTRSQSPLNTLVINASRPNFGYSAFANLLRIIPNLRHLALQEKAFRHPSSYKGEPRWLGESLALKISACGLLPDLQGLTLQCLTDMDERLLLMLVRNRMIKVANGETALEYLQIVMKERLSDSAQTELEGAGLWESSDTLSSTYTFWNGYASQGANHISIIGPTQYQADQLSTGFVKGGPSARMCY